MIWTGVAGLFFILAIIDAVRYLKPDVEYKMQVLPQITFPVSSANEIILVYNAWGGIYPGLVDFVHKEFFPKSYPCNLCYQTFGTFGMKEEWKQFLDSLPFKKTELHKDEFKKKYQPEDLPLPAIMIGDRSSTELLVSAEEINRCKTLQQLKELVRTKLKSKVEYDL